VNPQNNVLLERLRLLNEYINDLRTLQRIELDTYQENKIVQRAVERTLHLAVEACLDINQHLIALKSFRTPEDNKIFSWYLAKRRFFQLTCCPTW